VPVTFARDGILNVATGASLNITGDITSTNVKLTKIGGGAVTVTRFRATAVDQAAASRGSRPTRRPAA
jgi:hypothetical protein